MNGNNILIGTMNGSTFTAFAAVKSHDISSAADSFETASATQQEWKEFMPGRKEWSINVNYLVLENANSNIEDLMKVGSVYAIRIKDRNGSYKISGNAICLQCKQNYIRGNIATGSFALKGSGPLTNQ